MNIYSTVPEEAYHSTTKPEDREKVLSYLKKNEMIFMKARKIAEMTGLPKRSTQVEVRKIIAELICIDKEPIISNSAGFCYTTRPNMIRKYAENLELRIQGIQRRIKALHEIANEMED